MKVKYNLSILLVLISRSACSQIKGKIDFESYNPPSSLVVPEHPLTKAKYPFIDVHNHQYEMPRQDLKLLLNQMDSINMKVMVNLSGKGFKIMNGNYDVNDHQYLKRTFDNVNKTDPKRLIVFTNISFTGVGKPGWAEKAVQELEADVKAGARGLKIYKSLGFSYKDTDGHILKVDDPRLDPIWKKCGDLGIPVLIHTADPKQFWQTADEHNERWLELLTHPDRQRSDTDPAPWDELIEEQHNLFRKHKNTTFIAAHFGWYANDLDQLGKLLDELPNVVVEFGAVIAELGRQPRRARQFFEKYQDRILFGKDNWIPSEYSTYFRVLETEDEYFPYHKKYHAFWRMYGIGLSDEILKKVYYKNALRIIPGIDKNLFPE